MNLVVDFGNTRGKAAFFDGTALQEKFSFQSLTELTTWIGSRAVNHLLVASVSVPTAEIRDAIDARGMKFSLTPALPAPINNAYLSPHTLGVDRIAAACGAFSLFPERDVLVIDAGTCINYEFLDARGNYHGGAISPGLRMRFESVHQFTAKLPLVEPVFDPLLTGRNTEECIQSGIVIGLVEEIKGRIARYTMKYPNLRVVLCGGDSGFFENVLKPAIFVAPDLVLMGLNGILLHNVKN